MLELDRSIMVGSCSGTGLDPGRESAPTWDDRRVIGKGIACGVALCEALIRLLRPEGSSATCDEKEFGETTSFQGTEARFHAWDEARTCNEAGKCWLKAGSDPLRIALSVSESPSDRLSKRPEAVSDVREVLRPRSRAWSGTLGRN